MLEGQGFLKIIGLDPSSPSSYSKDYGDEYDVIMAPSRAVVEVIRDLGIARSAQIVGNNDQSELRGRRTVYLSLGAPIPSDAVACSLQRSAASQQVRVVIEQQLSLGYRHAWALPARIRQKNRTESAMCFGPATLAHSLTLGQPIWVENMWTESDITDVHNVLLSQYPGAHHVHSVDVLLQDQSRVSSFELKHLHREIRPGGSQILFVPSLVLDGEILEVLVRAGRAAAGLLGVVHRLRAPGGCPWDQEQDHRSLRPFLLEECHELLAVLAKTDPGRELTEELGDVLLQVLLHAVIASERGQFGAPEVMATLMEKMVRRHPHVFAGARAETPDDVEANWERIKRKSRRSECPGSLLESIPDTLPALLQAEKVQSVVSRVGFDWDSLDGPLDKVKEETGEFSSAVKSGDTTGRGEELGDLLFSIVNVARHLSISPEAELLGTVARFRNRFRQIEMEAGRRGIEVEDMTLEEMDQVWDDCKDGD